MNQLLAMRAYIKVVEAASFSRAANQLKLPPSTVSKLVTDLEKHLGIKLIHRTTRSVAMTTEGQLYYQRAVNLVAAIEAADNELRAKDKPQGHLRIEVPVPFAHDVLIPALPEFHYIYPDITLALGITDKTVNMVGEGVDCAIRGGTLQDQSLVARKLLDMTYVTCAAPSYLKSMGVPQTPQQLKEAHKTIIYFSATTGKTAPLIFMREEETVEIVNGQFAVNEGAGIIGMMLAGLGVGQQLKTFVQPYLDSGQLVQVLSQWQRPILPFYVVYRPNKHQQTKVTVFIDWLIKRFNL